MRALLSVSDKTGILEFARKLEGLGVEIISTGGTYQVLKQNDIRVKEIEDVTGFKECLDGRLKTLHPMVHGGILARRDNTIHMEEIEKLKINPIDLVVVNLYPFKETIKRKGVTLEEAIENIDIGGPTMLRAAAKNYQDVAVIVDPADYTMIGEMLEENGSIALDMKFNLCQKVFRHTASYDAYISNYLSGITQEVFPETLTLTYEKVQDMRYGENPHQKAAFYKEMNIQGTLASAIQLQGKELSFNNINDTNGALELLKEFNVPTIVACKHGNPCGVGSGKTINEAYLKAYQSDKISIFGGILVGNEEIDEATATAMKDVFLEVLVAPSYSKGAIEVLAKKKNLRVLKIDAIGTKEEKGAIDIKKVHGGIIVQEVDSPILRDEGYTVVTDKVPTDEELIDLMFAWNVVKFVKSNGIVLAKNQQTIGIGPGQVNRIWALKQAVEHSKELIGAGITKGSVLASDAFFPFEDCVEEAHQAGVTAIIQPGGSIRDQDSIDACNRYGIAMIFTNMRHFRH